MSRSALPGARAGADLPAMNETEQSLLLELEHSEELCRTWAWRFEQFTALGFDSEDAAEMADDSHVDLAQARRLITLGCPLGTASRILL
jgi:hypothetical protein